MHVLVSDTSVLVDLERGSLLEASFRLPFRFVVPDLLYERELKNYGGEELIRLGLVIEELDGDGVSLALTYRQQAPALSLPDCFALALAQTRSWVLLSGDSVLRQLATDEAIECHGVLWLLDRMRAADVVSIRKKSDQGSLGDKNVSTKPRGEVTEAPLGGLSSRSWSPVTSCPCGWLASNAHK